jgi:osmotically-inducible protein OsmY
MSQPLIGAAPRAAQRDFDVEAAIITALQENKQVPRDCLRVSVHDGTAMLMGHVNWKYERAAAETVTAHVPGVRTIDNRIHVEIA